MMIQAATIRQIDTATPTGAALAAIVRYATIRREIDSFAQSHRRPAYRRDAGRMFDRLFDAEEKLLEVADRLPVGDMPESAAV